MALRELSFQSFAGGKNSSDRPASLRENEFLDSLNVTLDDQGFPEKRLGYEKRYVTANSASLVVNCFYWSSQNKLISQQGTGTYIDNTTASFHDWSTNARIGMCEFGSYLVMIHPVDGVKLWNGSAISVPTNAPKGSTVASWQNRVWSAGDPTNPARVSFSDLGTAAAYTTTSWVDILEKDNRIITCLVGASGQDEVGRPGLIAFKEDSTYRIHDNDTGDYVTVDWGVGAASNIAAVGEAGRVYLASPRGIYFTDGMEPCREVSHKIEPFFRENNINRARPDLFAAGKRYDRLFFSFPAAAGTSNSKELEHQPGTEWCVEHNRKVSCYATLGRGDTSELVFGSADTVGRIYNSHVGGSDDGVAIASRFKTRFLVFADGRNVDLQRIRVNGFGTMTATPYKDFEVGTAIPAISVSIGGSSVEWDGGEVWDGGATWGPTYFQSHEDYWLRKSMRSASVLIEETSTNTTADPNGATQGAWVLDDITFLVADEGIL